ncbi:MAG: hypothetical protein AAF696_13350 [Bacteroidota bacterium]
MRILLMLKGSWKGYYQFTTTWVSEEIRKRKTACNLQILQVDGSYFSGTVEDDLDTGGMEGQGAIKGELEGRDISFVKEMPIQTFMSEDGSLKQAKGRHPKIYYSGKIDERGTKMSGSWRIKIGLRWQGLVPLIIVPTEGLWEMKKEALD